MSRAKYPTNDDVAQARAGDKKARERVVRGMEGLCHFAAGRYVPTTTLGKDELVQQARIAVLSAIDAFDPRFKVAFHNYAFTWMRALLTRLCITENPNDKRNKRARAKLGPGRIGDTVPARHIPLDEPASNDFENGYTLAEILPSDAPGVDEAYDAADQSARLRHLANTVLHGEARAVIHGRLDGETLQSLADRIGVSRERVRQMELQSRKKLRQAVESRGYV